MNPHRINMVFHGQWNWVFEQILNLYQHHFSDYSIIPSVHPIKNSDVYQYWRPGSVRAQKMSQMTSPNHEFYRKGIHMVHDSPYDKKRSNSDYRITVIERYHSVLCTSKEQFDFYSNYHDNVHYFPLGVFEDRLMELPNQNQKLSLGFKARLYTDGVKGEQLLIDIARMLDPNHFKFTIESPNAQDTIHKIRQLGFDVNTNGNIDILLVCSRYEGTPLPLVEACASGVYVLSTPVGESKQLLNQDQICSSSQEFATRLNHLYDNRYPLKNFISKGPNLVKGRTWDQFMNNTKLLWDQII